MCALAVELPRFCYVGLKGRNDPLPQQDLDYGVPSLIWRAARLALLLCFGKREGVIRVYTGRSF